MVHVVRHAWRMELAVDKQGSLASSASTERNLRLAVGRWAGFRPQVLVLGISVALREVVGARDFAADRLAKGRAEARRLGILRPSHKSA